MNYHANSYALISSFAVCAVIAYLFSLLRSGGLRLRSFQVLKIVEFFCFCLMVIAIFSVLTANVYKTTRYFVISAEND